MMAGGARCFEKLAVSLEAESDAAAITVMACNPRCLRLSARGLGSDDIYAESKYHLCRWPRQRAHLRATTSIEKSVPSQRCCWGQNSVNTMMVPAASVKEGRSKI